MFCPKCGNEIPDDSKFCVCCGANLSGMTSETVSETKQTTPTESAIPTPIPTVAETDSNTPEFVPFHKKTNKKKLIGIAAGVAVVAALALKTMSSSSSSGNAYVYLSDGKYELLTNIEKDESVKIASGKNDTVSDKMVAFSPDGKYVYYYTKYDHYEKTGSLCRAEYGKLKENSAKNDKYIEIIATNVSLGFEFLDDGSIIYKNGSGTLYHYRKGESVQIAKSVMYYYTDKSDRVAYLIRDGKNSTLYGIELSKIDDKIKLASNVCDVFGVSDFDNILYTKEEDDGSRTLYVVGFTKDSEKLAENVTYLTSEDEKVYFLQKNGVTLNLYDYVVDDYADADSGITKPDIEDYSIPTYGYYKLDSDSDLSEYEEIYTSCTKPNAFYRAWYSYGSLEDAARGSYENQDTYKTFVDKYKSQEDEEGYIAVTDSIKTDLIALANTCGDGSEDEWKKLCFYKKQNGTSYDYDSYHADCDKYDKAEDRIRIRTALQDKQNEYPVCTIYCFENGKLTAITEDALNTQVFSNGIMFNTSQLITDTVDMTKISFIGEVTDLFDLNYEMQNYVVDLGKMETYQMSADTAEALAETYDKYGVKLYLADDKVYMGLLTEEAPLSVASISNGQIGNFTIVTDDALIQGLDGSTLHYATNYYRNSDNSFCDLYSYDGKESKCLVQDVLYKDIVLYDNGDISAYTGYRAGSGYELTLFNSKGEKTIIGDNITQYIRVDESTLLYISDGDLYAYDGKTRKLVHTDVEWLWSLNSMKKKRIYLKNHEDYGY